MMEHALSDLRVLDLTSGIAGPYGSQLLAGLGADVVKVEPPGTGDRTRQEGPFPGDHPNSEASGLFLYLNAGKRSVTLDLTKPTGRALLDRLIARSDMMLLDFAPQVVNDLGLDYRDLAAKWPDKVIVAITAFGLDGPYCDYQADEIVIQALSGLMDMTGDPAREPLQVGVPLAQYATGATVFAAALTARYHQVLTGEGQLVDISLLESLTAIMEHSPVTWAYRRVVRKRTGNWGGPAAWGIYPCKDGHVGVISGLGESYQRFLDLVGPPLTDEKFRPFGARAHYADEINAALFAWLTDKGREEVYHLAQAHRLPFSYVCDAQDVLRSPQLTAREYFATVEHPVAGRVTYPGAPFRLGETPWQNHRAPLLGEHNEAVYVEELGVSQEELVRLRQAAVI